MREGQGFPRAGRTALRDFPRAKPEGNPEEQPCQPEENPVLPDSFTQIYILFLIVFRIGPPKMHRRFRICLPKMHIIPYWPSWIRIDPPESVLALLNPYWPSLIRIGPPEMHRLGLLMYPVYYVRKALKILFEIECIIL